MAYFNLLSACLQDNLDEVKQCIARGDSVHVCNWYDETPLHIACRNGNLPIVVCLIVHGASLSARDENGLTPLNVAYVRKDYQEHRIFNYTKRHIVIKYIHSLQRYTALFTLFGPDISRDLGFP